MADNEQNNDEYKFVELDGLENDMMEGMEPAASQGNASYSGYNVPSKTNIKRNALLALVAVIFIMLMYKIIGYMFFTSKEDATSSLKMTPPVTQVATAPVKPIVTQPIQEAPEVHYENTSELTKKIASMELSQQNVRSEVDTVSQQVGTVNSNIDNLNNQIASLNQVISTLSTQMSKQTEEISMLMARTQPKHIVKSQVKSMIPQMLYTIQAVIPGRAWIIGSNGSTLTVREGTKIAGYGIVKLIDPLQGRVLTSSGKVIRFSQEDS